MLVDITLHRTQMIEQKETHQLTDGALRYFGRARCSCSTSDNPVVLLSTDRTTSSDMEIVLDISIRK
jgi:hypothetical protein